MLRAIGVNNKIIKIIENMYSKTLCSVVIDGYKTEWFEVLIGVRQGCLLSPTLFNVFLDFVMEEVNCLNKDLTFEDNLNMDLKYADDTTLIASIFELLQLSTTQLEKSCEKFGMKVNGDKCKLFTEDQRNIILDGLAIEKANSFVFLGSQVPGTSNDVKRRIALAANAFGNLKKTLWSRKDAGIKNKLRLFYALIVPIAIYASETWALTKKDARALKVFENNCLRTILGFTRLDRIPISRLHKMTGRSYDIEVMIRKRRLTWFGHMCRLSDDNLVRKSMKGDFKNARGRGRPPKRWTDLIKGDTALPIATAEKYAKDRIKWRRLVDTKWCKASTGVC